MKIYVYIFFSCVCALMVRCNAYDPKKHDSPTKGEVNIIADEGLKTIAQDFEFYFENNYSEADINLHFASETEALNTLTSNDSMRIAIVATEPGENELSFFKSRGITHHVTYIGKDCIVLIVNHENEIDSLTADNLKALVEGKITNWKQLGGANENPVQLVFDSPGSGLARFISKKYTGQNDKLPAHFLAMKTPLELIERVKKDKNIIGFIGYNMLSDKDDSLAQRIKKQVKVLALSNQHEPTAFVKPSQTSIADSTYPLIRRFYAINREGKSGLGTGFVIFMASHKGQRILLKAGMVPAVFPGRNIRFIRKNVDL